MINIFLPVILMLYSGFLQNWYRFINQLSLLSSILKVFLLTKFLISIHKNA